MTTSSHLTFPVALFTVETLHTRFVVDIVIIIAETVVAAKLT